ncbi:MAG: tail fiber assembly protein [Providencia sp.]|uniref:tail fiber assembly protein n=1 Tax=Providencia sp. TaxID=589 RepID=UPI003F987994
MNYYIDKKTNEVYAYDDEQLSQISRITEVEKLLTEKEPLFLASKSNFNQKQDALNILIEQLNALSEASNDEVDSLKMQIEVAKNELNIASQDFVVIESEYYQLKTEYDDILPVLFDMRENLKVFKKMTDKEVDAYINPPISKEQLIAEAEQHKQSLLAEANNAIAPLQYAESLGIATAKESTSLIGWKKYSVYLNRVDTSTAPDIEWPEKP